MRIRFFERTYLFTLALFLLFLNGGVFALAFYTYGNSVTAAEQVCRSEEAALTEAFLRDLEITSEDNHNLLLISYGTFYTQKGITLKFEKDGEECFSNIPDGLKMPKKGELTDTRSSGKRYIIISRSADAGGYYLTYAKDVSYLDENFSRMTVVFVGASVTASALLAVILYFLLRKLYLPLNNLRSTAEGLAEGNYSVRADEKGNDEFSELAKAFNTMACQIGEHVSELEATARQRQRMLDDLAHEMRTPLTGIHGYAEYILTAKISEDDKIEAAQFIMSESMRLKNISETLLDMAFVRENRISKVDFVAKELLSGTCDRFRYRAIEKNINIYCEGGDFLLQGDRLLLELLLSNLTENALGAVSDRGEVELGASIDGGKKVLYVKDSGRGMTAEQLSHITEPFYRTDKARNRRNGGTGLGLALCERIAKAHGAELIFSSVLGEGTVAKLIFPDIAE